MEAEVGGRAQKGVSTGTRSGNTFQDESSMSKQRKSPEVREHVLWHEMDGQKCKVGLLREFSDKGGPWRESVRQAAKLFENVQIHLLTHHSRGQPISRFY